MSPKTDFVKRSMTLGLCLRFCFKIGATLLAMTTLILAFSDTAVNLKLQRIEKFRKILIVSMYIYVIVCVCVCVCVREKEREREREFVCVCVCVWGGGGGREGMKKPNFIQNIFI